MPTEVMHQERRVDAAMVRVHTLRVATPKSVEPSKE
jgi:hypothetical protein